MLTKVLKVNAILYWKMMVTHTVFKKYPSYIIIFQHQQHFLRSFCYGENINKISFEIIH